MSIYKLELLMKQAKTGVQDRPVIAAANEVAERTGQSCLRRLNCLTGRLSPARPVRCWAQCPQCCWTALKKLAGIPDEVHLISKTVIEPIQKLKVTHLGNHNPRLHTDEVLLALCICANTDPNAERAMQQLSQLRGCEVHSTVILSSVDENVFSRLGVNLTCEPKYQTGKTVPPLRTLANRKTCKMYKASVDTLMGVG